MRVSIELSMLNLHIPRKTPLRTCANRNRNCWKFSENRICAKVNFVVISNTATPTRYPLPVSTPLSYPPLVFKTFSMPRKLFIYVWLESLLYIFTYSLLYVCKTLAYIHAYIYIYMYFIGGCQAWPRGVRQHGWGGGAAFTKWRHNNNRYAYLVLAQQKFFN